MNIEKMNEALDFLRLKYGAEEGRIELADALAFLCMKGERHCILAHRVERRFTELRKIATDGTLEGISTLRFASFAPRDADMRSMLARELDLAVFLGGGKIARIFAVQADNIAINALAKLENGVSLSVEIGVGLPKGREAYDRHEIIAARGVASDQTVDTHTPHASIRCFGENSTQDFTDVDTELFGLNTDEVWTVRAAFYLLQNPNLVGEWDLAAAEAQRATAAAFKSDSTRTPVTF